MAWLGLSLATVAWQAVAADPKASRFYEDALARYEKRDYNGAILQLRNAIQVDSTMLPVHVLLGKALLTAGDVGAAEVAFAEAIRLAVNRAAVVVAAWAVWAAAWVAWVAAAASLAVAAS